MNTDNIIALSTAIIALAAVGIAIWQGYLNRAHFRLSVKPHIVVHWAILPGQPVTFTMTNNGLGPAIIKKFFVVIDGKEFNADETEPFPKCLQMLNLLGTEYTYHLPTKGDAVGVNQKLILLELKGSNVAHEELAGILERMKFKVIFSSMYNDKEFVYFDNC